MSHNVRLKYLDGTTEHHAVLNLRDTAAEPVDQQLQTLDADGWWRSFRPTGKVDAEGFAVFEEDPTVPKIKNTSPRALEGNVWDEGGHALASAKLALVDRRDGEILGEGITNEAGHFHLTTVTPKGRVSHHYVIMKDGIPYDLFDASVVAETADAKVVDLRVRRRSSQ